MDDLISRQTLIDAFKEEFYMMYSDDYNYMINFFNNLPTAEKKSRWLPLSDGWAECLSCGNLERAAGLRWRYCPKCGARMEE